LVVALLLLLNILVQWGLFRLFEPLWVERRVLLMIGPHFAGVKRTRVSAELSSSLV
jgi:hypothetical protein